MASGVPHPPLDSTILTGGGLGGGGGAGGGGGGEGGGGGWASWMQSLYFAPSGPVASGQSLFV